MADQYITSTADKPWHRLMARAVLGKPEADPRQLQRPEQEPLHISPISFENVDEATIRSMITLPPSEIDQFIHGIFQESFREIDEQGKVLCLLQSIPAVSKGEKSLLDALQEIFDKAAEYDRLSKKYRWIPCTENLPPDSKKVLLYTKGGEVYRGYYDHKWRCWRTTNTVNITHWRKPDSPWDWLSRLGKKGGRHA